MNRDNKGRFTPSLLSLEERKINRKQSWKIWYNKKKENDLWRQQQKERAKINKRKHKEKYYLKTKLWHQSHPENRKKSNKKYNLKNKEKIHRYHKNYYNKYKEKIKHNNNDWYWNRGGREKAFKRYEKNPKSTWRSEYPELLEAIENVRKRDHNTCQWQGCHLKYQRGITSIEVHHIFPRSEYPDFELIEQYMICYCANHHGLWHRMRGDRYSEMIPARYQEDQLTTLRGRD